MPNIKICLLSMWGSGLATHTNTENGYYMYLLHKVHLCHLEHFFQ